MNDNVKKVFDILGVKPNEKFKIEGFEDIYHIDAKLRLVRNYNDGNYAFENHLLRNLLAFENGILKIPRKKHVGDLMCKTSNFKDCMECPLYAIDCGILGLANKNLYEAAEDLYEKTKDQEIYNIIKARLDKEVEK